MRAGEETSMTEEEAREVGSMSLSTSGQPAIRSLRTSFYF